MGQLGLFRNTDPETSRHAAAVQHVAGCERDVLEVLANRGSAWSDLTSHEIWGRHMGWRDPGTVKTCLSRLAHAGFVEVTGRRVPHGKRVEQATYAITEVGRAALHG